MKNTNTKIMENLNSQTIIVSDYVPTHILKIVDFLDKISVILSYTNVSDDVITMDLCELGETISDSETQLTDNEIKANAIISDMVQQAYDQVVSNKKDYIEILAIFENGMNSFNIKFEIDETKEDWETLDMIRYKLGKAYARIAVVSYGIYRNENIYITDDNYDLNEKYSEKYQSLYDSITEIYFIEK